MSKVVRAERAFAARRRASRRRAFRPLVAVAVVATLAAGGWWVAFRSPAMQLETVVVKGTSRLSAAEVRMAARAPIGRSLLSVDPGLVRARVAALRGVAGVQVDRDWPHRLVITVRERTPVAQVREGSVAELVDASGVAFAAVPDPPAGLVPLTLGAPVPGPGDAAARAAMQVWQTLPASLRTRVSSVHAPTPDAVELALRGGRTIIWGSPGDANRKLTVLALLLARPARSYDISTPDVPVTR